MLWSPLQLEGMVFDLLVQFFAADQCQEVSSCIDKAIDQHR